MGRPCPALAGEIDHRCDKAAAHPQGGRLGRAVKPRHERGQAGQRPASNEGEAAAKHDQRCNEDFRSEEHTSELQSLMRISYAVFCLKKKIPKDRSRLCRTKSHTNINIIE